MFVKITLLWTFDFKKKYTTSNQCAPVPGRILPVVYTSTSTENLSRFTQSASQHTELECSKMDWLIAVLLLSLLLQPSSPLVRTLEVSPRVEANHDTFLYLCSLDVNEQNIGVVAYRNYQRHYFFKTWLRGILPFTLDGEQGSLDGREQPKFWTRTKGCSCETPCVFFYILFMLFSLFVAHAAAPRIFFFYFFTMQQKKSDRSDFNSGDEEGPYTNYNTGVQFEIGIRTEYNEELLFKVFRSLPEWNVETQLGTTTYWLYEATHTNNNSVNLLDQACDEDAEMVDCRRSLSFPTWNDTIPAYYPG